MSDEIYVIDVGGYIGNSTREEIEYAKANGKAVNYYSKSDITDDFLSSPFQLIIL